MAAVKMFSIIVTRRSFTKPSRSSCAWFFSTVIWSWDSRACRASNDTSTYPEKSSWRNGDNSRTKKPDQGTRFFPLPEQSSN